MGKQTKESAQEPGGGGDILLTILSKIYCWFTLVGLSQIIVFSPCFTLYTEPLFLTMEVLPFKVNTGVYRQDLGFSDFWIQTWDGAFAGFKRRCGYMNPAFFCLSRAEWLHLWPFLFASKQEICRRLYLCLYLKVCTISHNLAATINTS